MKKICITKKFFFLILYVIVLSFGLYLLNFLRNATLSLSSKAASYKKPVRIISGTPVDNHNWPFVTKVYISEKGMCSGSFISKSWIITAAHCFDKVETPNQVYLIIDGKEVTVDQYIVYEGYYSNKEYDIALVELNERSLSKVNLANISSISFFEEQHDLSLNKKISNNEAFTASILGYGAIDENNTLPQVLQKADLQIRFDSIQKASFRSIESDQSGYYGDSGAPLVYWSQYRWKLLGTAIGINKYDKKYVTVFVDVRKFATWIEEKTGIKPNSGNFWGTRPSYISPYPTPPPLAITRPQKK